MKLLKKRRQERGDSIAAASRRADISNSTWGLAESGRFIPYPVQLERMAAALEYEGDPADLLAEVSD
jgi:transcriptional regulator with XRE-family HTH domain